MYSQSRILKIATKMHKVIVLSFPPRIKVRGKLQRESRARRNIWIPISRLGEALRRSLFMGMTELKNV